MLKAATITKSFSWLTALTASIVLTCGCTPTGSPERTPVPEPSPSATQAVETPAPYTPPAKPYAQMSHEELFAEADKVLLGVQFWMASIEEGKESENSLNKAKELVTPRIYGMLVSVAENIKTKGIRVPNSTQLAIRTDKLLDPKVFSGSNPKPIIVIQACKDGRALEVLNANGKVFDHGRLTYDKVGFLIQGEKLVISDYKSERTEKCPF